MEKFIVHGIGKSVLRDFKNPKKVISFVDAQDLSVESSSSKEDITGGNKLFPIASFKQDQALACSLTNATFDSGLMEYLDGAEVKTGAAVRMTDIMEVAIPEDGAVKLNNTPVADTIVVNGFEAGDVAAAGTYKVAEDTLTFAAADAGKVVAIVYEYESSTEATEYSVGQASMSKPFIFETVFPVYDEDTQIKYNCMLKIFKAQCTSGFKLNLQHRAPFAPQIEFEARDAKRPDGKLWTLVVDTPAA